MTNLRQKLFVGEPQEGLLKYLWPKTGTAAEGNRRNCSCSLRLAKQVSTFASARDFLCGLWSLCQFVWVFCSGFLPQAKTLGEDSKLCIGLIWFGPCMYLLRRLAEPAVFCCCCFAALRRSPFPTLKSILHSRSEQHHRNRTSIKVNLLLILPPGSQWMDPASASSKPVHELSILFSTWQQRCHASNSHLCVHLSVSKIIKDLFHQPAAESSLLMKTFLEHIIQNIISNMGLF